MVSIAPVLLTGRCVCNRVVCREHYRLTVTMPDFPLTVPGQFVTIAPAAPTDAGGSFYLRRAFSISGLRRAVGHVEVDLLYRVVGSATRWMASIKSGERVSLIGPLGNGFPIAQSRSRAWLVAGGVGLPPMLWLSEVLHEHRIATTAFCGARTADLLPLSVPDVATASRDACSASLCAAEFSSHDAPAVLCTDDGSLGYRGAVVDAVRTFCDVRSPRPGELVVYACGPEGMLQAVAEWARERNILCYVCTERAMACGMGTCQSCVIPMVCDSDPQGWQYKLCCTDGPVFDSRTVAWVARELQK